jgi:hypothetical protein
MIDGTTVVRLVAVLALVIGLILLATWLIRRVGLGSTRGAAKSRRLSVIEVRPLDAHRRLVLVGRDEVRHLLLIGGTRDLVIETGIADETEGEPLERVRFRDVIPETGPRILRPGRRVGPGDDA